LIFLKLPLYNDEKEVKLTTPKSLSWLGELIVLQILTKRQRKTIS